MSFITNQAKYVLFYIFHGNARPTCRPPAQRLSSSDSSMCTTMASAPAIATSSGGKWSIGDPCICGAAHLGVWDDNADPHGQSASVTIVLESDCRSSYASPSNPSMTTSQSHECHNPFGSTSSSRSVCLALSSLSSPLGLSVCGLQLGVLHLLLLRCGGVIRPTHYSAGPVLRSGLPPQGCTVHNFPRSQQTSPQPR